ncbi:MAG: RNA degradosome polyphosphate kinase, partial [Deltaproteobacteria bacterium]|nr:RNA degradosome polyphosphate kinase [Deltaproteobacteria bacterium]
MADKAIAQTSEKALAPGNENLKAQASAAAAGPDLSSPQLYLNRELTWLRFNSRVLHEAADIRTPLLERVKFLSITGSNLDEFFMKRIGGLMQQVAAGVTKCTIDGLTPLEQIDQCAAYVRTMLARQHTIATEIVKALSSNKICILR